MTRDDEDSTAVGLLSFRWDVCEELERRGFYTVTTLHCIPVDALDKFLTTSIRERYVKGFNSRQTAELILEDFSSSFEGMVKKLAVENFDTAKVSTVQ